MSKGGLSCNHGFGYQIINVLTHFLHIIATCQEKVIDGREFPTKVMEVKLDHTLRIVGIFPCHTQIYDSHSNFIHYVCVCVCACACMLRLDSLAK